MNYKKTNEIKDLTGIDTPDLVKLCKNGCIDYYIDKTSKHKYRINFDSLQDYLKTNKVPTGAYRNIEAGTYALLFNYDYQYAANTITGEIVNFDNGGVLTPSPNRNEDDGTVYYQVYPIKGGKRQAKLVHQLIMEAGILPNNRGCDNVHHIDGDASNNRPGNLLPTFSGTEHKTLDRLRDSGDKKEYMKMIKKIRKLNAEKLFVIPHPDYQSDKNNKYFMWITPKGFNAYKSGKEIPLDCIRREAVEKVN